MGICRKIKFILSLLCNNKIIYTPIGIYRFGLFPSPIPQDTLNNAVPVMNYAPKLKYFKMI